MILNLRVTKTGTPYRIPKHTCFGIRYGVPLFVCLICFSAGAVARVPLTPRFIAALQKPAAPSSVQGRIEGVLKKYRSGQATSMKVKRKTYQALTEKEVSVSGHFIVAQGKLRMEFEEPEKSLWIMNGPTLWMTTYLPQEFGGKAQVTKLKTNKLGKAASWIGVLFGKTNPWKEFKVASHKDENNLLDVQLIPVVAAETEVASIRLILNTKSQELKQITVVDTLDNKTSFDFSDQSSQIKIENSTFNYTPPKDAEVMEL